MAIDQISENLCNMQREKAEKLMKEKNITFVEAMKELFQQAYTIDMQRLTDPYLTHFPRSLVPINEQGKINKL